MLTSQVTRIVVVDDHLVVRDGVVAQARGPEPGPTHRQCPHTRPALTLGPPEVIAFVQTTSNRPPDWPDGRSMNLCEDSTGLGSPGCRGPGCTGDGETAWGAQNRVDGPFDDDVQIAVVVL